MDGWQIDLVRPKGVRPHVPPSFCRSVEATATGHRRRHRLTVSLAATTGLDLAMVITTTSVQREPWEVYFQNQGAKVDYYTGSELAQLTQRVRRYDVVLYGFNVVDRPTQAEFDGFLSATDAAGVGVVFLSARRSGGLTILSESTGSPETVSSTNSGVYPGWNFFQVSTITPSSRDSTSGS